MSPLGMIVISFYVPCLFLMKERIIMKGRKNVIGPDGIPITMQNLSDEAVPYTRPDWDPRI